MRQTINIENLKFDVITSTATASMHLLKQMYNELDTIDKTSNDYIILIILIAQYIHVLVRNDYLTFSEERRLYNLLLKKIL